jgi:hypothetical protein
MAGVPRTAGMGLQVQIDPAVAALRAAGALHCLEPEGVAPDSLRGLQNTVLSDPACRRPVRVV